MEVGAVTSVESLARMGLKAKDQEGLGCCITDVDQCLRPHMVGASNSQRPAVSGHFRPRPSDLVPV